MSRRRLLLVAVLVLAVVGVLLAVLQPWRDRDAAPRRAAVSDRETRSSAPPATGGGAPAAQPVELAGPITLSAATVVAAPEAAAGELAGRVLDWGTGAPVPG